MAQYSAGEHHQRRGYMTVRVVNHGIIESIGICTAVIRTMIKFDADKPQDFFRQNVQWMLAIH